MPDQIRILLVEDNEGDIVLTLSALEEARLFNKVDVVRDGEEALLFLQKKGNHQKASTPDIIFLDINLPKISGTEILHEIKTDAKLKTIPVIMLTTSDAEKDILLAYTNHANCYITKPVGVEKFMEIIYAFKNFWISLVKLPNNTP